MYFHAFALYLERGTTFVTSYLLLWMKKILQNRDCSVVRCTAFEKMAPSHLKQSDQEKLITPPASSPKNTLNTNAASKRSDQPV